MNRGRIDVDPNCLIDLDRASQIVPLHPDAIVRRLKERDMPVFRWGRKLLVREVELLRLLREPESVSTRF